MQMHDSCLQSAQNHLFFAGLNRGSNFKASKNLLKKSPNKVLCKTIPGFSFVLLDFQLKSPSAGVCGRTNWPRAPFVPVRETRPADRIAADLSRSNVPWICVKNAPGGNDYLIFPLATSARARGWQTEHATEVIGEHRHLGEICIDLDEEMGFIPSLVHCERSNRNGAVVINFAGMN